jgi:hypothetical protein
MLPIIRESRMPIAIIIAVGDELLTIADIGLDTSRGLVGEMDSIVLWVLWAEKLLVWI